MDLYRIIKILLPDVKDEDFKLRDNSDGKGPFIDEWSSPLAKPTKAQIAAVSQDDVIKETKKELIKHKLKNKFKELEQAQDRVVILAKALNILFKHVTVDSQTDINKLLALKAEFKKSIDIERHAENLKAAVDANPNADIDSGWDV